MWIIIIIIYFFFLAALALPFYLGLSLGAARGLLIQVISLVVEHWL